MVISAVYFGFRIANLSTLSKEYDRLYDAIETEFDIKFPDDVSVLEHYNDQDWFHGDGDVYTIIDIPEGSREVFADQIRNLNWIAYPTEIDAETIEQKLFDRMNKEISLMQMCQEGYIIFQDKDGELILYSSKGEEEYSPSVMIFFYDVTNGQFYYFRRYT